VQEHLNDEINQDLHIEVQILDYNRIS